jgi:hypothetical protein
LYSGFSSYDPWLVPYVDTEVLKHVFHKLLQKDKVTMRQRRWGWNTSRLKFNRDNDKIATGNPKSSISYSPKKILVAAWPIKFLK